MPAQAQYWPMGPADEYGQPHYQPEAREGQIERRRPHVTRAHARSQPKLPDAPKESSKPQGPIVITISIDKQQLKLYDQNGLFAESPVSTGMRGHSTPMGVFSVIQKNKYHRSNIYSGAPMPYMQRITWSGIAMHAGVLPGYPASHGCIRMPMNFAMRMWGWTRMGARVIVTPGEVSPADFSHPLLVARKMDAKPVAAAPAPTPATQDHSSATTPKSDKSSIVDVAAHETPQLRLTSMSDHREPVRTADASGAMPESTGPTTKIAQAWDAGRDGSPAPSETPKAESKDAPAGIPNDGAVKGDATKDDATKNANGNALGDKPAGDQPADKKTEAPKADKDQARATDPVVAPAASAPVVPPLEGSAEFVGPVKPRSGHVAAYVSRKDNKIYVRQNFEPWFEAPVTIAASDRPLGTHVFTVRADKDDADALRWSVVSLPARAARVTDDTPRRKRAVAVEPATSASSSTPKEALDRLTIPDDTMKRIASVLAPGGSLTVSDLGLGDETGRGTDFIVPLK